MLSIWWDNSLHLVLDREDVKLLKEMDFIVRSMISTKSRMPKGLYENRLAQIPFSSRIIYN
jgi:hypothetical protein